MFLHLELNKYSLVRTALTLSEAGATLKRLNCLPKGGGGGRTQRIK